MSTRLNVTITHVYTQSVRAHVSIRHICKWLYHERTMHRSGLSCTEAALVNMLWIKGRKLLSDLLYDAFMSSVCQSRLFSSEHSNPVFKKTNKKNMHFKQFPLRRNWLFSLLTDVRIIFTNSAWGKLTNKNCQYKMFHKIKIKRLVPRVFKSLTFSIQQPKTRRRLLSIVNDKNHQQFVTF